MLLLGRQSQILNRLCRRHLSDAAVAIVSESKYPQLSANIRDMKDSGSTKSRMLRKNGLVPGVLYGVDENRNVVKVNVSVKATEIMREFRKRMTSLENTLYELNLDDGSKHIVTPRQMQLNPLTDQPVSVNFLKYWPGNIMRIPFEYINETNSEDLQRDCLVVDVTPYVDCVCDGDVPITIQVDLGRAKNRDVIRLSSLTLPPGVRPAHNVASDKVICVIKNMSK